MRLLSTGIKYLKDSYIITNILNLENEFIRGKESPTNNHYFPDIHDYTTNNLLDAIKVIICFENFLKGKIISKGYLVHAIDARICNKKFKTLGNINKHPIKVADYKRIEGYVKNPDSGSLSLRGLKHFTVQFSAIMNTKDYLDIVNIPKRIHSILMSINTTRNRLHLNSSEFVIYTQETIKDIKYLIEFANKHIIEKYNYLCEKWNPKYIDKFRQALVEV